MNTTVAHLMETSKLTMQAAGTSEGVEKAWETRKSGGDGADRKPGWRARLKQAVQRVAESELRDDPSSAESTPRGLGWKEDLENCNDTKKGMKAYGTSEGVEKGWEERRRSIGVVHQGGWKGRKAIGGVYRMNSPDGKNVVLVHNDGGWEHFSLKVAPMDEGAPVTRFERKGGGVDSSDLARYMSKNFADDMKGKFYR